MSVILLSRCAPKHATTWVHPAIAAASAASPSGPSSVTSPRVSSTVPGGHASRSDDAALDEGSRVSTRHRHPDEVRRVTILRPTRPAPPTTRTSSSPFRSSFAGAAASGAAVASDAAANVRVPQRIRSRSPDDDDDASCVHAWLGARRTMTADPTDAREDIRGARARIARVGTPAKANAIAAIVRRARVTSDEWNHSVIPKRRFTTNNFYLQGTRLSGRPPR